MADLSSLKQRVELVDLRLKTAHGARERESAALMDSWEKIRDRFIEQNEEITQLRDRVAGLEDARDDLLQMVHGLLSAVEGGLDRMSDESVPQIRTMAANLLAENGDQTPRTDSSFNSVLAETLRSEESYTPVPAPSEPVQPAADQSVSGNLHGALLESIEQSIDTVRETSDERDEDYDLVQQDMPAASDYIKEAASPGIRDLVARIETAVGPEILESQSTGDDDENDDSFYEEDDELSRDLQEIEALRGELHGLRQRISSGAA